MPIRVLLVDDSRPMRDYVGALLDSSGDYEIVEAGNGFEALRELPRGGFDLIVSDVNMPDMTGVELFRFVRKSNRHSATPILAMSSEAEPRDLEQIARAGANDFLAKPFSDEELVHRVVQLVQAQQLGIGSGA